MQARGGRSDRPEHSAYPPLPIYNHHSLLVPFLRRDILGISRTMKEIDFLDLIPGLEGSRKIARYILFFLEFLDFHESYPHSEILRCPSDLGA